MPGFFTTAFRSALINHAFGGPDRARAATLYFAALTTAPAADGSGAVETTYAGYGRVAKTNNNVNCPAAANGQLLIGTDITFPEVGAGQVGTVDLVGIGVYEQAVGGTPIGYMPAPQTVKALDSYYAAAGTVGIEFNNTP